MDGLLQRAQEIREGWKSLETQAVPRLNTHAASRRPVRSARPVPAPEHAKAADDDQEDIIRQIELVVAQSKIKLSPELFTVRARSNGIFLPLLVNGTTLVLLAASIFLLTLLFSQREQQQQTTLVRLESAEGSVIAEIKKESEARMAAKEQEIADINKRLGDIALQRDGLATNMESKISQREAVLRKELASELEAERIRLRAQGYSEEEVTRRMKDFERQKNGEFLVQLAGVRQQADTDRKKIEDSLREQESAFNQNLVRANQDRDRLITESRQREADLRKRLQEQATLAANQASNNQGQLEDASAQIRRLGQVRDQEKQAASQIAGFYSTIKEQLRLSQWDKAKETVLLLKSFLLSDQLLVLENMRQRRDTETFVADSLLDLIAKEQNPVAGGPSAVSDAQAARVAQESAEKARVEMEKALSEAEAKFQAQVVTMQKEADLSLKRLQDQVAEANSRNSALSQIPVGDLDRLRAQLADQAKTVTELRQKLAESQVALTESTQRARDAEEGLRLSANAQTSDLLTRIKNLDVQVAALNTAKADADKKLSDSFVELEQLKKTIGSVQTERDSVRKDADLRNAQIESLKTETERIRKVAGSYEALTQTWADYLKADKTRSSQGTNAQAQGKVLLDTFLSGAEVRKLFPGIFEQIHAFDRVTFESGTASLLPTLGDKLYDIASFPTQSERLKLIKKEIDRAASPQAKEFYQNLHDLVALQK